MVFSVNVCMILSLISLLLCYTLGTHFYEWMRKLLHAHFIFWMWPNHITALFTSLDSSVLCCLSCISLSIALEINYFSWLHSFLFLSGILISRQTFSLITQKFKLKRVPAVDRLSCVSTVKGKSSQGCLLGQETPSPFTDVFPTVVTPISRPSIHPMPADIQGQVERTTGGLSVTERCNRLALLVTSPLIPADRCEECSRLVGRSHWLIGRISPWAIVQTLSAS